MSQPFKRLNEIFLVATQLVEAGAAQNLFAALSSLPEYKSRGHGVKHNTWTRSAFGKWRQYRSKYLPHQGKRECARRVAKRDQSTTVEAPV